eukprot:CAMPEP_0177700142 /NCGR_PEP_ID=MMETSP0484_2-20121128/5944_1 /TAXON_ID=354590 /ORGANISM="Rhodomonas lens, Strain RHODO" /LENGTH=428 /DNA_ID=CAMNT_0019211337 /DNA_START=47 /DNA_END=1333 /DNA_ORIENTATION=+
MSNIGKFHDTAPNLPAAGKVFTGLADTTAACFSGIERPPTPDDIKKYRKSFTGQPGKRIQHWGTENDGLPRPEEFTYGVKGAKDMGVGDTLGGHLEPSTMQAYQQMRAEMVYDSSKKEPLGRSIGRNYNYPEAIKNDPNFRFGVMGSGDKEPAITAIFPPNAPSLSSTEDHIAMYKKSHGSYEPGEQRKRDYTWDKVQGGIDPGTHIFGATAEIDYRDGVAKAFNPDREYESGVKPTEFVPKNVADFRKVRADELGTVRNLGLGQHTLNPDHVYGLASQRFNDWGARECLQGNYTAEEQQPDPDLGRSLRRGLRSDRTFGVPCVRSDIMPPKMPSVADSKNYGNEPGAKPLLYPQPFAVRGVYEEDFLAAHPKAELKDIIMSAGVAESEEHFEQLYKAAQKAYGKKDDEPMSVESIRQALYAEVENGG